LQRVVGPAGELEVAVVLVRGRQLAAEQVVAGVQLDAARVSHRDLVAGVVVAVLAGAGVRVALLDLAAEQVELALPDGVVRAGDAGLVAGSVEGVLRLVHRAAADRVAGLRGAGDLRGAAVLVELGLLAARVGERGAGHAAGRRDDGRPVAGDRGDR